jgi:sec-independent protein translocase protein TatB
MLDMTEIIIIGVVALIFIGPKELPGAIRTLGNFVGKARHMAREFQGNVDDMVREAELDAVKKQVQALDSGSLDRMIEQTVDPKGELAKSLAQTEAAAASAASAASPPAVSLQAPAPADSAVTMTAAAPKSS